MCVSIDLLPPIMIKCLLQPKQAEFSDGYLGVTGVSAEAVGMCDMLGKCLTG